MGEEGKEGGGGVLGGGGGRGGNEKMEKKRWRGCCERVGGREGIVIRCIIGSAEDQKIL